MILDDLSTAPSRKVHFAMRRAFLQAENSKPLIFNPLHKRRIAPANLYSPEEIGSSREKDRAGTAGKTGCPWRINGNFNDFSITI